MIIWVADVFDYSGETPFLVGVFDTEEKAWEAIEVVMNQMREVNPNMHEESRFVKYVTPVQLNGFTPACMDWCYSG